jgi:hypothetical protein
MQSTILQTLVFLTDLKGDEIKKKHQENGLSVKKIVPYNNKAAELILCNSQVCCSNINCKEKKQ